MNEHLDDKDREIVAQISAERKLLVGAQVGDIVLWPNGEKRRISDATWEGVFQTSKSGSFFIFGSGGASYSGALQPPVLREYVVGPEETALADFWFFHHNRAGAVRGVQAKVMVGVYRLKPFCMTKEQAEEHPRARRSAEVWGRKTHPDYLNELGNLMNPPVISNPDWY